MRVVFDDAALDDLERIYAWIAKDRPANAATVIARIFASADRLGSFPHMGRPGRDPGTFEWVIPHLPYILVFELDRERDELAVTAIFHGAQDR